MQIPSVTSVYLCALGTGAVTARLPNIRNLKANRHMELVATGSAVIGAIVAVASLVGAQIRRSRERRARKQLLTGLAFVICAAVVVRLITR